MDNSLFQLFLLHANQTFLATSKEYEGWNSKNLDEIEYKISIDVQNL
jgi:hypothetical protein